MAETRNMLKRKSQILQFEDEQRIILCGYYAYKHYSMWLTFPSKVQKLKEPLRLCLFGVRDYETISFLSAQDALFLKRNSTTLDLIKY